MMELIGREARRVPLRIRLLGVLRWHAANSELDPASAIEDVHVVAGRLTENDLAEIVDDCGEQAS